MLPAAATRMTGSRQARRRTGGRARRHGAALGPTQSCRGRDQGRQIGFGIRNALVEGVPVVAVVIGKAKFSREQMMELLGRLDLGNIDLHCASHDVVAPRISVRAAARSLERVVEPGDGTGVPQTDGRALSASCGCYTAWSPNRRARLWMCSTSVSPLMASRAVSSLPTQNCSRLSDMTVSL